MAAVSHCHTLFNRAKSLFCHMQITIYVSYESTKTITIHLELYEIIDDLGFVLINYHLIETARDFFLPDCLFFISPIYNYNKNRNMFWATCRPTRENYQALTIKATSRVHYFV